MSEIQPVKDDDGKEKNMTKDDEGKEKKKNMAVILTKKSDDGDSDSVCSNFEMKKKDGGEKNTTEHNDEGEKQKKVADPKDSSRRKGILLGIRLGRRPLGQVVRIGVCNPRFRWVNIACLGGPKKEKENKDKKPDSKDDEKAEELPVLTAVMRVDGLKQRQEKIKVGIVSYAIDHGTEPFPSMFMDTEKNLFTVQGKLDMKLLAKALIEKVKVPVEIVVPPKDYEHQYPCRRQHSEPSEADTPYVPPC